MAGVLVVQGEGIMLEALVNKTAPLTLVLKLFKNNVIPAKAFTEASMVEADFLGYAPIILTPASWVLTPGTPSSIAFAQRTFSSSAGAQNQPVYGYWLEQMTSGKLVVVERFPNGPYTIVTATDQIKVTPSITQD